MIDPALSKMFNLDNLPTTDTTKYQHEKIDLIMQYEKDIDDFMTGKTKDMTFQYVHDYITEFNNFIKYMFFMKYVGNQILTGKSIEEVMVEAENQILNLKS